MTDIRKNKSKRVQDRRGAPPATTYPLSNAANPRSLTPTQQAAKRNNPGLFPPIAPQASGRGGPSGSGPGRAPIPGPPRRATPKIAKKKK